MGGAILFPAQGLANVPWLPSDNFLQAAAGDLDAYVSANSGALTAGTLYLSKIQVRSPVLANNVVWPVAVAGVGASSGSFAGIYSSSGQLLAQTADIGAGLLAAPTLLTSALVTPVRLPAGSFVWAAFLVNLATTQPALYRSGGLGTLAISNGGILSASLLRFATNGTGLVALPASINPASNSGSGAVPMWAGLS